LTSILYREGALADGRADRARLGVSILVTDGRIAWIRSSDDERPLPAGRDAAEIVDAARAPSCPG
jgi:cytosine/adenosine deaminase-related metal-dependent hydrolase